VQQVKPRNETGGTRNAARLKSNKESLRDEGSLVKRLPEKFTRNRYQFEQLCRTEDTAIYVQHINGRQKVYEVVIIGVADRRPVKVDGRVSWTRCEPYECYPGNEAWGTYGWTYTSEEDARAKYDLLNDPAFKVPAPPIYPIRSRVGISQDALEAVGSIKIKRQRDVVNAISLNARKSLQHDGK
jgi:hypothetical protein